MHGKAHGVVGLAIVATDGPSGHAPAHLAGVISLGVCAILARGDSGAEWTSIAAATHIASSNLMWESGCVGRGEEEGGEGGRGGGGEGLIVPIDCIDGIKTHS